MGWGVDRIYHCCVVVLMSDVSEDDTVSIASMS